MQTITPILLLLTFSLFLSSLNLSLSCNPSDKKVLLDIKTHFKNASIFSTWDPKTDCCQTWSGIQCNSQDRVTLFAFSDANDVTGVLPPALGELPYLQYLAFTMFPNVIGPIPNTFSKLTNLQRLRLGFNNLNGPIPKFIGNLKGLTEIQLLNNSFSGPIPSELGQLANLRFANLGGNHLSGPIPDSLGHIKGMSLYLYANHLSGRIPSSLYQLPYLGLSFNQLVGPIPRSFSNANFTLLDLSNNMLTQDASSLFGKDKTALTSIDLSYNRFSFNFSKVKFPIGLQNIDISHNMIYGSIPNELGQLPSLDSIDVSFNQLSGPIPTGLSQFGSDKFSNNKDLCGPPLKPCSA